MLKRLLSNELIRYGISGVMIALINFGVFTALLWLGLRYEIANIFALVASRFSGFAFSKYFVFRSNGSGRFWREFWGFMLARGFSGLVDYFGLILLVGTFHLDTLLSKWAVMILVIILNYVFGKFLVFRKRQEDGPEAPPSENERKYRSKNPLRQLLTARLNNRLTRLVTEAIRARPGAHAAASQTDVLDAGCGEGYFTGHLLRAAPALSAVGLDASEEALAIAREKNPQTRFLCGSVYELPFPDGGARVVVLCEVLEHLDRPELALREIARVAEEAVIVSVPHEPWFRLGNLLTLRHVPRLGNPTGHVNHWTRRGFRRMIQQQMAGSIRFYPCFPWNIAVIEPPRGALLRE